MDGVIQWSHNLNFVVNCTKLGPETCDSHLCLAQTSPVRI